jgi:hypothetical protein
MINLTHAALKIDPKNSSFHLVTLKWNGSHIAIDGYSDTTNLASSDQRQHHCPEEEDFAMLLPKRSCSSSLHKKTTLRHDKCEFYAGRGSQPQLHYSREKRFTPQYMHSSSTRTGRETSSRRKCTIATTTASKALHYSNHCPSLPLLIRT